MDATDGSATASAADRVVDAILGTRESAAEGDYRRTSTGVTWTDPVEAGVLRDVLAAMMAGLDALESHPDGAPEVPAEVAP